MNSHYDYIIAGAGLAGRSLILHAAHENLFRGKKVLLVDKARKHTNDHTWCFWENTPGPFEPIVYNSWEQLHFHDGDKARLLHIAPLKYKMVRAKDFYRYTDALILTQPNIEVAYGDVGQMVSNDDMACIVVNGQVITADYVFSSIPAERAPQPDRYHYFLQHFKGWLIETPAPLFDENAATIMDFRTSQQHGAAFFYVLPLSGNRALIEYTLFSPSTLADNEYREALSGYIEQRLGCKQYKILEEEIGIIPMTDHPFPLHKGRIINLGAAAGQIKGSTGYAFQFIQRHAAALVKQFKQSGKPYLPATFSRFRLYDSIMLQVLASGKLPGRSIFSRMFRKNKPNKVFRFLDNQTGIGEELAIFSGLQKRVFLQAALKTLSVRYMKGKLKNGC